MERPVVGVELVVRAAGAIGCLNRNQIDGGREAAMSGADLTEDIRSAKWQPASAVESPQEDLVRRERPVGVPGAERGALTVRRGDNRSSSFTASSNRWVANILEQAI